MEIRSDSPEKTKELAYKIADKLKPGDSIALYGCLGSGKTTFVSYLAKALNSASRVQSPTFVLHRKYKANCNGIRSINHIDLYRIPDQKEVMELGLQELIEEKDSVALIEWPEVLGDLLPDNSIKLYFTVEGENLRKIDVQNLP